MGFTYDEILQRLKKMQDAKEWVKALEPWKAQVDSGNHHAIKQTVGFEEKGKQVERIYFFIILKEQFRFSDEEMCELAHECLHITHFLLDDFLSLSREYEAVAYTHTLIMRKCLAFMRGKKI